MHLGVGKARECAARGDHAVVIDRDFCFFCAHQSTARLQFPAPVRLSRKNPQAHELEPIRVADSEPNGDALRACRIALPRKQLHGRLLAPLNADIGVEVRVNGQHAAAACRQGISRVSIGQDVPVITEIVPHAEGVCQLVGQDLPFELSRHQGHAALFRAPGRRSEDGSVDQVAAVVDHHGDDTLRQFEDPSYLLDRSPRVLDIVAVWMLPIHPVNHRIPLVVRLDAEGGVSVPVRLHLLAIEGLDAAHLVLHPLHHVRAEGSVVGQEVEQPHRAGIAGIQVRQPLSGGMVDAGLQFGIEDQTGMQAVRGRRGRMADNQGREDDGENEPSHDISPGVNIAAASPTSRSGPRPPPTCPPAPCRRRNRPAAPGRSGATAPCRSASPASSGRSGRPPSPG